LEEELRREQERKKLLENKVADLEDENIRLQQQSHSTQDQFKRFKEWLLTTVEQAPINGLSS